MIVYNFLLSTQEFRILVQCQYIYISQHPVIVIASRQYIRSLIVDTYNTELFASSRAIFIKCVAIKYLKTCTLNVAHDPHTHRMFYRQPEKEMHPWEKSILVEKAKQALLYAYSKLNYSVLVFAFSHTLLLSARYSSSNPRRRLNPSPQYRITVTLTYPSPP